MCQMWRVLRRCSWQCPPRWALVERMPVWSSKDIRSRRDHQHGGRDKDYLLAAAFEAVIAAVYLDSGLLKTQEVFMSCFMPVIEQCATTRPDWDYKGMLQTQTLSTFGCTPMYQVIREEGPAHQKTFHVQLTLNHEYGCIGIGRSKKAAEQQAARQLLALLEQCRRDDAATG